MQRNTGYFPTESLEPSGNRLFSRSALNEGDLFRGSLESHAITNVSLMCNYHGNRYIWLQWETPTEFLVINGENRYTQTLYAPDGTTYQEEQIEPQFALIKKEDYWNSVPNYIPIESLQN